MKRFWDKVEKTKTCWNWTGCFDADGYGRYSVRLNSQRTKTYRAPRLCWELAVGKIPAGLLVCHKCDNRACLNPSHLFLDTPSGNSADMVKKNRQAKGLKQGSHTKPESVLKRAGEKNGLSKLTWERVAFIRKYKNHGIKPSEMARNFGVNRSAIWKVILGETWRANQRENIL